MQFVLGAQGAHVPPLLWASGSAPLCAAVRHDLHVACSMGGASSSRLLRIRVTTLLFGGDARIVLAEVVPIDSVATADEHPPFRAAFMPA